MRWRLVIFTVALGLRLVAIGLGGPRSLSFGDARDYLAAAKYLCTEHSYPDRGSLPFFRAPMLPAFAAVVTLCHPDAVPFVKVALAVVDAGTALIVGEIGWLLFRSRKAATVAGAIAAIDPFFVLSVVDVRTEPLFMFFMTVGILLLLRSVRTGDQRSAFLGGAAFAASALTRPAGLAALGLGGIALLLARGTRKGRLIQACILFGGGAVVLSPWAVRNALRYHELILVNDAAGYNVWRGFHPEMDRIGRIEDREEYHRAAVVFETELTEAVGRGIEVPGRSPNERSRAWFAAGVANMRQDPAGAIRFAGRKALRFWCPWLNPQEHGRGAVAGSAVVNLLLFGLAAIGLTRFWKEDQFIASCVIAFFTVVWLAHIPYQVVMRFRIPFTDPLLIAFAARAISDMSHFDLSAARTPR